MFTHHITLSILCICEKVKIDSIDFLVLILVRTQSDYTDCVFEYRLELEEVGFTRVQ